MKSYFPFTDYDFYAYLTSGALFLSVIDFAMNEAKLVTLSDWTFVQIVVAVAASYVIGHILATLAQLLIETFIVSKVISKPITLQLGYDQPNVVERFIEVLVGRYYGPLDEAVQEKVKNEARLVLSKTMDDPLPAESVFQAGFRRSFSVNGARSRIDSFLNQYGFCRNISLVALLATIIFAWRAYCTEFPYENLLVFGSMLIFVGMFVRFIKFYSSFQAEVCRCLLK